MGNMMEQRARFTSMKESTKADWDIIVARHQPFAASLPDRVLGHLKLLSGDTGGFAVDRLQHSLLTATLAHKGGEDEEYVVCALLHDIGDTLGSWNHTEVSAAILKPFVSEANHWMVEKHGIFQGYFFSSISGSMPACVSSFAATRILSAPPASARSTTIPHSIRQRNARRCPSSNRWFTGYSLRPRTPSIKMRATRSETPGESREVQD